MGAAWQVSRWATPKLKTSDRLTLCWFFLCGLIHCFFEGYFALNHARMGNAKDLFGQLWKEYALSDSRYLTSDPFTLWMETITAFFWGPLSLVLVYMISADHPLRHPIQAMVSMGQIYGLLLYYATALFEHYYNGLTFCRPEGYYFWFYYVAVNAVWLAIPGPLLVHSVHTIGKAFQQLKDTASAAKPQANGHIKHD